MFTRRVLTALAIGVAAGSSGCATSSLLIDAETARTNTHTVLAFEETVFNRHRVEEGFERYVAADFRQHSAALPDNREGSISALRRLLSNDYPASRVAVERTVAQGDLVAVQLLWDQKPGQSRALAKVDIYRLQDGRIVEHWDVTQSAADSLPGN